MLLALDLGSSLGWAVGHGDAIASGVADVRAGNEEPVALRYVYFREFVEGLMVNPWKLFNAETMDTEPAKIETVAYEMPFIQGIKTRTMMYGFSTRVHELCALHRARYMEVHTASLKKFATGYGRALKPHMLAAAQAKWPEQHVKDDNQADALHLLAYVASGAAAARIRTKWEKLQKRVRDRKDEEVRRRTFERMDRLTSGEDTDACVHDWNSDGTCALCGYNPEEEE